MNAVKTLIFYCAAVMFMIIMAAQLGFAQTPLAHKDIDLNKPYMLDEYSVLFDNVSAEAKLNEFNIEFYDDTGAKIGETQTQTLPKDSKLATIYSLDAPIAGISKIRFTVYSLYADPVGDFDIEALQLGLNDKTPPPVDNKNPVTKPVSLTLELGQTKTFQLSDYYSDPDGDSLTALEKPGNINDPNFDYSLKSNGALRITAHALGEYSLRYAVRDNLGGEGVGAVSVRVKPSQNAKTTLAALAQSTADLSDRLGALPNIVPSISGISGAEQMRFEALLRAVQAADLDEIEPLKQTLRQHKDAITATNQNYEAQILTVQARLSALQDEQDRLLTLQKSGGGNTTEFQTGVERYSADKEVLTRDIEGLEAEINAVHDPVFTPAQLDAWQAEFQQHHAALPPKVKTPDEIQNGKSGPAHAHNKWRMLIFAAAALVGVFVLTLFYKRASLKTGPKPGAQNKSKNIKRSDMPRPPKSGVIFKKSPILATLVAPLPTASSASPIAPLGQSIPSGLQTLSGQFAVLKPAYQATGRIGYAQEGVPIDEDVAMGTGFLISENLVMTNQHVYEHYKYYLEGDECAGIEFMAELGSDQSDFTPFDGRPPRIFKHLDIAVFRLAKPVTHRAALTFAPSPLDSLDQRGVVVIGYPCPYELDDTILSAVEPGPIFAVKRISQGHIFRHSTDIDAPYGVVVQVEENIAPSETMNAICHNASTLAGNSGSPVLDAKTGELLGVHFAGDRAFHYKEAANFAMAIARILEEENEDKNM